MPPGVDERAGAGMVKREMDEEGDGGAEEVGRLADALGRHRHQARHSPHPLAVLREVSIRAER